MNRIMRRFMWQKILMRMARSKAGYWYDCDGEDGGNGEWCEDGDLEWLAREGRGSGFSTSSTILAKILGERDDETSIILGVILQGFVEGLYTEDPSLTYSLISTGGGRGA